MIFVDQMQNLKVYRNPLFLPTIENDKKNGSSVLLLTPDYESSRSLITHPLLINKLRYQSYYAERDLTRFLSSKILDRVEESTIEERETIHERWFKTQKDLYYNKDKFENGEINLCFVTGLSGSGKSTYSKNLAEKYNAEYVNLDIVIYNKEKFTMDELKKESKLIYSFFNTCGKKYYFLANEKDPSFYNGDNYDRDLTNDFVDYAIKYAKSNKNKKIILEGIWLYLFVDINKLLSNMIVIKGTSALASSKRALKRDIGYDTAHDDAPNLKQKIKMSKHYIGTNLLSDTIITRFRKFLSDVSSRTDNTIVYESNYPDNLPEDIKKFNKYLNTNYKYGVIHNGKIITGNELEDNFNFYDDYRSLSISEFEKYKTGVCWDYVHYEAKWFKDHGYKYETYYIEVNDNSGDCPTHTFLVFYLPNSSKAYYFESSWYTYRGIEEFNNINSLLKTVKDRHTMMSDANIPGTCFHVKFDALSKSFEHIGCVAYMKKASNNKTYLEESMRYIDESKYDIDRSRYDWDIDNGIIEKTYGIIVDNRYNACIKLKGYEPLRARSEVIILNDKNQVYIPFNDDGTYELPGGSWNDGEDAMQAAIRETREEARINVKDVYEYLPCIEYYEPDEWQKKHIPEEMQWYGNFNQVYIAMYDSHYDGIVEKEDQDPIAEKGKFYNIKDIKDKLDPGHLIAIEAYLYRGLRDRFIEDDIEANNLIRSTNKNTILLSETPLQSSLDKDFKKKGYKSLSSFRKVRMTKAIIDKYKDQSKILIHQDPDDKGYFFMDGDKLVAIVAVDNGGDSGDLKDYKCISCIEVFPEYRGLGLSRQLLDIATKELGAEMLTVAWDNEVAISLYKSYGFKISKSSYERVKRRIPGDRWSNMYVMFYKIKPGDNIELINETCKDLITARKLSQEVQKLAKRYNANFFFVTDGASSYSNGNGGSNLAVKNARDEQRKWEIKNGFDPDEDWSNDITNIDNYRLKESFILENYDLINEDSRYDAKLKSLLYNDRIRQRKEILELNKQVKNDLPFIKYVYPDFEKYGNKNVFIDFYYYNEVFFRNNDWEKQRGFDLYYDLLNRLFDDNRLDKAGYKKKTIFIPVLDWNKPNTKIWSYRESINPISIIYELLFKKEKNKLLDLFRKNDVVFFGKDKYFKINFFSIEDDTSKISTKFRMFISKLVDGQEFDLIDIDTASENKESPEAIKANIIDKIEVSKGVDLTGKGTKSKLTKDKTDIIDPINSYKPQSIDTKSLPASEVEKQLADKTLVKGTDTSTAKKNEKELQQLAKDIERISQDATDTEDAINQMEPLKSILIDLDSMKDDSSKVDSARTARMNNLDKQFLDKQIQGKSIRDILGEDVTKKEIKKTSLNIASPNEEWNDLTFMNFDKEYDIDRDIVACLKHFQNVSNPISIRNIDVTNNSTSEDRVNLYTVEMEDTRGKRFNIKFDVPIMIDNRFLLRGNDKTINTQLCNMPILKTDLDAAQIITNYQKVFVYRVNDLVAGRSLPITGRFLKAVNKYKGNKIKFYFGDNTKICNKYELPMDYIDIATVLNKIETPYVDIYFNQDEIRADYPNIDDSLGVPYAILKKDNKVKYFTIQEYDSVSFTMQMLNDELFNQDQEFIDLFNNATEPSSGTYSRCNMMSSKIPMIVVLGYMEGLTKVLKKANIRYQLVENLNKEIRSQKYIKSWIRFADGYLVYETGYNSCLLLNGFKECSTELYSIYDVDNKNIYLEMLDNFGGRIKADGIDNFYDCLIDPITKEVLEHYNLPTDVVSVFLYANTLLTDNKFTKHTDMSSRRIRRYEMVAAYGYEALSESYGLYSNQMKHNSSRAEFLIKQSVIIDKLLASPISSDDSTINPLRDLESTNAISFKGKSGLNSERAYSLDKRTYDNSMLNVLGASTGFSGNTGITRQTTIDMNVEGYRGYIKISDGNVEKMNTAKTMTATEAMTPFGSTRDDGMRTNMTFIQTAKHMLRVEESDPLLVTNGSDEALAYMTTDKFAFKAKHDGVIKEIAEEYIIVEYNDKTKDYVDLRERVMKNSDGGHYVPLKLSAMGGLKVGKKIKENDILAYDKLSFSNSLGESDNIAYNIGKLAKVAIINTDEGYEDSGVCCESMSKKLASRITLKEDRNIDKDATVFSLVKVGDRVEVNDPLIVWQDPYEEEDANILLKALTADQKEVSELGRRVIRSETSGRVTQINIYRTVELDELSDSLRKIVTNYEKNIKSLKKKLESEGIDTSTLPATYKLEQTGKLKNTDGIKIEIFVEYLDIIAVGDKIVYYSANKAVTKKIIPQRIAPYTDFRPNEPIDAFVSEVSIDKRMVGSTMIYGSLQKLMVELDRTCKDMAGIPYDDSKV